MKKAISCILCALWLLAGITVGVKAQSADVRGTVADETGAVIGAVQITLDDGQGNKQVTKSDEAGRYRFTNVSQGVYTLTAAAEGFGTLAQRVDLTTRRAAPLNLTLKVIITEEMQGKPNPPALSL